MTTIISKYEVRPTSSFRRDLRRAEKRGYDISQINTVIKLLSAGKALPAKYRDHPLKGRYAGYRECHITPDWLLVYSINERELILLLTRTGSHGDLFNE